MRFLIHVLWVSTYAIKGQGGGSAVSNRLLPMAQNST